jgi:hopanoid biosynthesis associated RND transporter like protein HpnN
VSNGCTQARPKVWRTRLAPNPSDQTHGKGMMAALALFCYRFPIATLTLALAVFAASIALACDRLVLKLDWVDLFSQEDPYIERVLEFREEFPLPQDLVVLAEGSTPEVREAFLDALAARLEEEPQDFQHILYQLDLSFVRASALYVLTPEHLESVVNDFKFLLPYLRDFTRDPQLESLMERFQRDLTDPASDVKRTGRALAMGNQLLGQLSGSLHSRGREAPTERILGQWIPEDAPVPVERILRDDPVSYNTLNKGTVHVLLVKPVGELFDLDAAARSTTRLRALVDEVLPQFPDVIVNLSGQPVLMADERDTCREDSIQASILSFVLVVLLYAMAFSGEIRRPAMSFLALIIGLGWTVGFTTLAIGHLNFITVSYLAMLTGMGIDFGIHITFRYVEERVHGKRAELALVDTIQRTGVDAAVGAVATASAFGVMGLTGFRGIGELGILAGGGVLLCFLSTITALPACLSLFERYADPPRDSRRAAPWRKALENSVLERRGWIIFVSALFTIGCALIAPSVKFDYNLLTLQDPGLESIQTEIRMSRSGASTVIPAISVAPDEGTGRELMERFQELSLVDRVVSPIQLLPAEPEVKTPLVEELVAMGQQLPPIPPRRVRGGSKRLLGLARRLELLDLAFTEVYPRLSQHKDEQIRVDAASFKNELDSIKKEVQTMGPGSIEDSLLSLEDYIDDELRTGMSLLKDQRAAPITMETLPEPLKARFIGVNGKVATLIFSSSDIWEREALVDFIDQLTAVDPKVLGEPPLMVHFGDVVARSHQSIGWWALIGVFLVLGVHIRSLSAMLLALLPTSLSVLWLLGIMALTGYNFNAANFVAIPMIVGIGCIFGVHVIHRIRDEGRPTVITLSTGPAVTLSALTTMAAFGSLLGASHQGISSLGFIITVGVGANMVASLLLLPCLTYRKGAWKKPEHQYRRKSDRKLEDRKPEDRKPEERRAEDRRAEDRK